MKPPKIAFDEVLASASTDRRLEVLRAIHHAGSISEAARANGVSYKAAWQALETLSNLAGVPLVAKAVGGSGGGGARLTPEGVRVLQAADLLHSARQQALAQIQQSAGESGMNWQGLAGVGLRTSMRNQLPCTVKAIARAAGVARISLALADGQALVSRITLESLELLGLQPRQSVLAMFKATAVTIAPTIVAAGDVNLLHGQVARRGASATGLEVSLQLASGLALVGFADAHSPLKLRQRAMAAVEPNAVVIAVTG